MKKLLALLITVICSGILLDTVAQDEKKPKKETAKAKKEETKERGMFNPMEEMSNKGIGTLAYGDAWDLFDKMILSEPLIRKDYTSYRFWKAGVYNKPFLTQTTGQYKEYPLRNSNGQVRFSDHFPVYLYLIKEVK